MNKTILCVDNGNQKLKEAASYLEKCGHNVYILNGMKEEDLNRVLGEIEQKAGKLDCLLLSANEHLVDDGVIGVGHDFDKLLHDLDEQLNGTMKLIDASLCLLRKSDFKRIGMITKSDSSISLCHNDSGYCRHMAFAGLNMIGKIYFNLLRPEGFTFRWYCDTQDEKADGGMSAGEYLMTGLCYDANEPYIHSDENRLVMRNSYLQEIPW